jgi:hypothetical protein
MNYASKIAPFILVPPAPLASIDLNVRVLLRPRSAIKTRAEQKPVAIFLAQIKLDVPPSSLVQDAFAKLLNTECQ